MKCNVNLDLSDELRNALACLLDGKHTKRLATRKEVAQYVIGAVEAAGAAPGDEPVLIDAPARPSSAMRAPLSEAEQAEARRLASEGKSPGYIRGWIYAGRRLRAA